jgi:pimeloyl-ACP methyl ester carboxylesterase
MVSIVRVVARGAVVLLLLAVGVIGGGRVTEVVLDLTVGPPESAPVEPASAPPPGMPEPPGVPGPSDPGPPDPAPVNVGPRFDERLCPDVGSLGRRCGFLDVPESRSDPEGRRVRVAVRILARVAQGTSVGGGRRAVVLLSGGPGSPLLPEARRFEESEALRDADVIVLDMRGSGRSLPSLACGGVGLQDDSFGLRDCLVRHLLDGIDVAAYTTPEIAADIEDLRRVLGYERFDLIGLSYGTRVALEVARDFPDGVRSIVLAAPAPHGAPDRVRALELLNVVDALDAVCEVQDGCREAYGSLADLLVRAMRRAGEEGGAERIDGLSDALFDAAYSMTGVLRIPRALAAIEAGDALVLEGLIGDPGPATGRDAPLRSPDVEQNSIGLFLSALCADEPNPTQDPTYEALRERLAALGASSLHLEVVSRSLSVDSRCDLWGVPPLPEDLRAPVRSGIPTLVLTGRFDPATPPRDGDLAARTLDRAQVVVAPHLAHTPFTVDPCVDSIVGDFLARPDVPVDTGCLARAEVGRIELP